MKELSELVSEKINTMIEDGTLEDVISERLHKTVEDSVDSAMKSCSDFGKSLKEKISQSVQTSLRNVSLPNYNHFVKEMVIEKFTKVLKENSAKHLASIIEDAIPPIEKTELMSVLMDKIQEEWGGLARDHGKDRITVKVSENDEGSALYVTFVKPDYDEEVIVTFYRFSEVETWHIGYIRMDSKRITGRAINTASVCLGGVEHILFQYYAMRTEFNLNTEIEDIHV